MTVLTTDNRRSYTGDGSTTVFAFPVFFLDAADVKAALRVNDLETSLVFNVDYTVAGAGNPSGGSVTFTTAPVSGSTVVLFADPPMTQTVDYQDGDEFPAETHEHALDKLTLLVQRLSARVARTLQYDETAPEVLSASDLIGRVTAAETARDQAQAAQAAAATSATAAQTAQASAEAASPPFPISQVTGLQAELSTKLVPANIVNKVNRTGANGAFELPSGTTAQRPSGNPATGIVWRRYNTDSPGWEVNLGSGWEAEGGGPTIAKKVFNSSGTWTKPAGLIAARIIIIGGGGGAAGYAPGNVAGGGGIAEITLLEAGLASSVPVTVGAGGAPNATGHVGWGGTGGTSSFGSYASASGGTGSYYGASNPNNSDGTPGVGTGGDFNTSNTTRGGANGPGDPSTPNYSNTTAGAAGRVTVIEMIGG